MPSKAPRFTKQKQHAPRQILKAAQYLRASTDQQQFSIENQKFVIDEYAKSRNIEIVRTYAKLLRKNESFVRNCIASRTAPNFAACRPRAL